MIALAGRLLTLAYLQQGTFLKVSLIGVLSLFSQFFCPLHSGLAAFWPILMTASVHPASCSVVGTAHYGSFTVFPNDKHRQHPFFFALLEVPRECILYFLNILRFQGPCSMIIPKIALHHSFNMSGTSHSSTYADPEMTSCQLSSKPYHALRLEFQTLSGLCRPQLHRWFSAASVSCAVCHCYFPLCSFPSTPADCNTPSLAQKGSLSCASQHSVQNLTACPPKVSLQSLQSV